MKEESARKNIINAVVSLEISKGHLKWRVSDLARLTKVSRPLIYYHLGKTKPEILRRSLEIIGESYFGFTEERVQMLKERRVTESLLATRQMFLKNPALGAFYQRWRMQKSPMQKKLIEFEKRYQQKLLEAFPHLSDVEVVAVHGIFHGLITAPFINEKAIAAAMALLTPLLNR